MWWRKNKNMPENPRKKRHFLAYKRRWALWGSLALLVGGTVAYNIATDDERIRRMVESALGDALQVPVKVENASFSLLRGLSVENVSILVDGEGLCDSKLLDAARLNVSLRLWDSIKARQPVLSQIDAQGVHLLICEDMDSHRLNVQRILDRVQAQLDRKQEQPGPVVEEPTRVPTISLSDASLTYARKQRAKIVASAQLHLSAAIAPMPGRRFSFSVLARTEGSTTATTLIGLFDRRAGEVTGRISDLQFDHALPNLLPSEVERVLRDLAFSGRFSIPMFRYQFPRGGEKESFEVAFAFAEVQAQIAPHYWLTRRENARLQTLHQTIRTLEMLGVSGNLLPGELAGDASDDTSPIDLLAYLQLRSRPVPLRLDRLSGRAVFTQEQISLENLQCRLQGQPLVVNGYLSGYSPDAPAFLHVQTAPGSYLQIPPSRQFITWLPDEVRNVYRQFQPQGNAALDLQLSRETPGADFVPSMQIDINNASFVFDEFPYPIREATGRFTFKQDPQRQGDVLRIERLRGKGVAGGPNADSFIELNGVVGPFIGRYTGVDLTVTGEDVTSEPPLRKAFPREVRKAMEIFGPVDYGQRQAALVTPATRVALAPDEVWQWPYFFGNFSAHILRPPGPGQHWTTELEIDLRKASGSLKVFPYPMENLSCVLKILDGSLTIQNLQMKRGDASLQIDGTVAFEDPASPDLQVKATHVPIDADLMNALPPTERAWIEKAGMGGHVDIAGRVFLAPPVDGRESELDFGLNLTLRDATLLKDAPTSFTALNGEAFLKPAQLTIRQVQGKRGDGTISTSGHVAWVDETPDVEIKLNARDLLLDRSLRDILPAEVQESWDQQQPEGTADIDLDLTLLTPAAKPGMPSPTTQPVEKLHLALRPRKLSATPAVFPVRIDNLAGEILVEDQNITLKQVRGNIDKGTIGVDGKGTAGPAGEFRLKLDGSKLHLTPELVTAMPSALGDVFKSLSARGQYDFKVDELYIRPTPEKPQPARTTPAPAAAATRPTTRPQDIDFACSISTSNGQLDIGLPVADLAGSAKVSGEIRSGGLFHLDGTLTAQSYKLANRAGSDFSAVLRRPPHTQELLIENIKSTLAGGSIAGGVTLLTPENRPGQYAVEFVARNLDVDTVSANTGKPLKALASGSVDVEGVFADTRHRRGAGLIVVEGENMYEAPVALGLFRMVHLALPVKEGVRRVEMGYSLSGDRVTFDRVEMTAPGLRIYGTGNMDFGTRRLDFTLYSENPDAFSVPVISDLVRQAQKELLPIRITGTLSEPKVGVFSFATFQTTLDQVVKDVKRRK